MVRAWIDRLLADLPPVDDDAGGAAEKPKPPAIH
jgi:hypothetical protein